MTVRQRLIMIAATGGGVGYFPLMPGTAGTLVGVPISLGLNRLATDSPWLAAAVLALAIGCAIAVSNRACDILEQKDPQIIVIDEIIGFLVANFLATTSLAVLLTSFLAFRFFDIAKVFPAARLEQLPRGAGVVLDDVMAGIYAFAMVQLLLWSGWL